MQPEPKLPVRDVSVAAFSMSRHPITFDQYDDFALQAGLPLPYDEGWGRGTRPVIQVNWDDAQAYIRWFSAQTRRDCALPSEAQWEYATRAGTRTRYSWGDTLGQNRANCKVCGSPWDGRQSAPVGSFEANPWGLQDVHGNGVGPGLLAGRLQQCAARR